MRRQKGFTLLELLIVIIIIGLLAAIGMVQYTRAIANAKNSQARAVLGEMRKAAMAFNSIQNTWPAAFPITVDLDGDGVNDVTYTPPTSNDFTFTTAAAGTGTATRQATAGGGVCTWTITYTTGTLAQSACL